MSKSKRVDETRQLPLDFESAVRVPNQVSTVLQNVSIASKATVHCIDEVRQKRQDNVDKSALEKILSHASKLSW